MTAKHRAIALLNSSSSKNGSISDNSSADIAPFSSSPPEGDALPEQLTTTTSAPKSTPLIWTEANLHVRRGSSKGSMLRHESKSLKQLGFVDSSVSETQLFE